MTVRLFFLALMAAMSFSCADHRDQASPVPPPTPSADKTVPSGETDGVIVPGTKTGTSPEVTEVLPPPAAEPDAAPPASEDAPAAFVLRHPCSDRPVHCRPVDPSLVKKPPLDAAAPPETPPAPR